jgi:hypothetical protein
LVDPYDSTSEEKWVKEFCPNQDFLDCDNANKIHGNPVVSPIFTRTFDKPGAGFVFVLPGDKLHLLKPDGTAYGGSNPGPGEEVFFPRQVWDTRGCFVRNGASRVDRLSLFLKSLADISHPDYEIKLTIVTQWPQEPDLPEDRGPSAVGLVVINADGQPLSTDLMGLKGYTSHLGPNNTCLIKYKVALGSNIGFLLQCGKLHDWRSVWVTFEKAEDKSQQMCQPMAIGLQVEITRKQLAFPIAMSADGKSLAFPPNAKPEAGDANLVWPEETFKFATATTGALTMIAKWPYPEDSNKFKTPPFIWQGDLSHWANPTQEGSAIDPLAAFMINKDPFLHV